MSLKEKNSSSVAAFFKKNSVLLYLLILPWILVTYFVGEVVVVDFYTPTHIPLDDVIPFCEWAVIGYVLWYPMLASTGLFLLFFEQDEFKKYMTGLGIAFTLATVIFLVFPNGQDLRPQTVDGNNICAWLVRRIYSTDTNTNVCPSMHVTAATMVVFAVFHSKKLRRPVTCVLSIMLMLAISASTVLIKQHSALDFFVAVPFATAVYFINYKLLWREQKNKDSGKKHGH